MKRVLGTFTGILLSFCALAQHELSNFNSTGRAGVSTTFSTDYQSIGINPANLGFQPEYEGKNVTFGLMEFAGSVYSEALTRPGLKNAMIDPADEFTLEQKIEAANKFTKSAFSANADVMPFGIAYSSEKAGGFAFNVRERVQWWSNFNETTSEFAFQGYGSDYFTRLELQDGSTVPNTPENYEQYRGEIVRGFKPSDTMNLQQILAGTEIKFSWYREYNVSYGRKLMETDIFTLHGGVGVKYIQGFSFIDIDVTEDNFDANGSFNPALGIDFGDAAANNPSAIDNNKYQPIGKGYGVDLGLTFVYKENTKLGLAVNNIGHITWEGNVYELKNTPVTSIESGGMDNYNIFAQANQFAGDDGIFDYKGKEKVKTSLPTVLRAGASHNFKGLAEVGVDMVFPVNQSTGNLLQPVYSLGGDLKIFDFVDISSGMILGGNYTERLNVPFGLTFNLGQQGSWELGASTRDVVTFLREDRPNLSAGFGFLRFRI